MDGPNGGSGGTRTRYIGFFKPPAWVAISGLDCFGLATVNGDHGGTRTHLRRVAICDLGFFGIMIVGKLDGGGGIRTHSSRAGTVRVAVDTSSL